MNTTLEEIHNQISEFSLFNDLDPETIGHDDTSIDFQQVLLSLASIFRQRKLAYRILYSRPDQPEFRLRSDKSFDQNVRRKKVSFSEPGRSLELKVESPDQEIFDGILSELQILGELEDSREESARETELNLLLSRTFQTELFAEYQRWKRYQTPLMIAGVSLVENEDWQTAAKAFKHVTKTRDKIGFLDRSRIVAFFPSVDDTENIKSELDKQIRGHFNNDEYEIFQFIVPDDIKDWNTLKNKVFDPLSTAKNTS